MPFFVFIFAVAFMTLCSVLRAVDIKAIIHFAKENPMTLALRAVFALCMNTCVAVFACGIWSGNWNMMHLFSREALLDLSYQQFFDFSLILLSMYAGSVLIGLLLQKMHDKKRVAVKSRKLMYLFLSSCFFLVTAVFFFVGIQGEKQIVISEFYLPDKKTTLESREAYIEIANIGKYSCETDGWHLSDDRNNLQKFLLPQANILSGETVLIPLNSNVFTFGEKGGDMLILSNANGEIVDSLITGDTRRNKSYMRNYAQGIWEYGDPSPGVYNLEKPQFSFAPGFYKDSFYLELSAQDNADIYYTWDGSIPTVASEKYSGKILIKDRSDEENQYRSIQNVIREWKDNIIDPTPVPKATVIRAIAVNAEGFSSEIATATYFVKRDDIQDKCVVSLVADPEDLFGPHGIHSTGEAYDQWYLNGKIGEEPLPNYEIEDVECPANLELFHITPQGYLNQQCSLRIQGGSTRDMLLQKRFSIFSREECSGSDFFEQNIFGSTRSHSVVLREGSTNALAMDMVTQRNVVTQKNIQVTVFLNGEFWYDTYLMEKYNEAHFEELYQLEEVEFVKAGVAQEMWTFVEENDLQTEDAYRRLNEMVDIQSYIDFMCANIYLGNTDYGERIIGGNSSIWRSRKAENESYGDGRWRWALYDMDLLTGWGMEEQGLGHLTMPELNSFTTVRPWAGPLEERLFYSNLRKNAEFRKQFVLTFMDMTNTCFVPEVVEPILIKHGRDMSYHDDFFLNRKKYITQYMEESYGLTGTQEELTLEISNPKSGRIQVNTCWPNLENGTWSGTYYTDYPVTITAEAHRGYRFVRWEGDICSDSPVISFVLSEGGTLVRAVYEPYEN